MIYTKYKNKAVDKYIQKKVDIVVETIRKRIPDTISIVMGGSFGRGEGGVYIKKKKIYLINDFDMFVITKKQYDEDFVNNVGGEATKKIGKLNIPSFKVFDKYKFKELTSFFYVDLKAISKKRLKELSPMIKYYELRNSSKVVYGKNVLKEIPDIKIEEIPLAEGVRLLMNRMSHMIQFFYPNFLKRIIKASEHDIFLMHSIKTYLAGSMSLLLLKKKYNPSYEKCMINLEKMFKKEFPELHKKIPEYPKVVREFTGLKLKMDLSVYKGKELELWCMSKKYLEIISKYYLSKFLKKNIKSWDSFSSNLRNNSWEKYYNHYISFFLEKKFNIKIKNWIFLSFLSIFAQIYLNWVYFKRIKENYNKIYLRCLFKLRSPELTFFSALPFILYSLDKDGKVNIKMLNKGKKILSKTFPLDVKKNDYKNDFEYWEKIANNYSEAYMLFAFLRIV